jgi:integrase
LLATLQERGSAKGKALSPKSCKHALALLRSALRWAARHDLVHRNVAEAVDAPSVPRSQARAPSEVEVARLFTVTDATRWGPFFRLALGTGARTGELLALRWDDVIIPDVGQATVTVRCALVETKGAGARIVEKGTKTDRVRTIPLGTLGIEAIRRQRDAQEADKDTVGESFADSGHVFQAPAGGPVAPFLATEAFRASRSRSNVKATLHDLRHTAASTPTPSRRRSPVPSRRSTSV